MQLSDDVVSGKNATYFVVLSLTQNKLFRTFLLAPQICPSNCLYLVSKLTKQTTVENYLSYRYLNHTTTIKFTVLHQQPIYLIKFCFTLIQKELKFYFWNLFKGLLILPVIVLFSSKWPLITLLLLKFIPQSYWCIFASFYSAIAPTLNQTLHYFLILSFLRCLIFPAHILVSIEWIIQA